MLGVVRPMTSREAFAKNIDADPTQQAVAARTAAYWNYVAAHGHPPTVTASGAALAYVESHPADGVASFRAFDAEVEVTKF